MTSRTQFKRHSLPIGGDEIPLVVASEDGEPTAVFMTYEAYLELAATVVTAVAALRAAGIDPGILDDPEAAGASIRQVG